MIVIVLYTYLGSYIIRTTLLSRGSGRRSRRAHFLKPQRNSLIDTKMGIWLWDLWELDPDLAPK